MIIILLAALAAVEILIVIVFIIHGILPSSLGFLSSFSKIDTLAPCTTATLNDVFGRDRFKVVAVLFFVIWMRTWLACHVSDGLEAPRCVKD